MVEKQEETRMLGHLSLQTQDGDIIYVEVRNMGKKGKGKKKKKPSTADSSKSAASSKSGKKGKKGKKKKKKEAEPEHYEFPQEPEWAKNLGLEEFYHGETDKEKFETTKLFRSYKMPVGHTVPNLQQQHVNIRNMHLRRFPELRLERGPNDLKMA